MIIREATLGDVDEIFNLGGMVDEFTVSDEAAPFWPKHILRNCVESQTDWLILAEENGEILGFIIVNNSPVFKKAILENIFVSPQHRKRGVGKKLLTAALKKIGETDCEYICALAGNEAAIDFSVKNGLNKGKNFVWMDMVLSKEFGR